MSVKLTFDDKNGKRTSLTFPTVHLADMYAKGVKNPSYEISVHEVAPVEVTKCGTPGHENYKRRKSALLSDDPAEVAEEAHETYMKEGVVAFLHGEASAQAVVGSVFTSSNVRATNTECETTCACGNKVREGLTSCYICRRYF